MSLFNRIKSPFSDPSEEEALAPEWPIHAVGEMLRERREELGLDLETAGAALRIKPLYLVALEQGRPHDLPGPTYAVGFIRAYAHYLGFDATWMLDRYKAETAEVHRRPDLSLPVPLGERSLPGGPILLVAAILALCGYGTWYYLSTGERAHPERVAAVPAELQRLVKSDHAPIKPAPSGAAAAASQSGAVAATAAASHAAGGGVQLTSGLTAPEAASPTGQAGARSDAAAPSGGASGTPVNGAAVPPPGGHSVSATAAPTAIPANDGTAKPAGLIEIRALADCWVQLRTADQAIIFSRVLKAGEIYRVPQSGLIMRVGNAGALAIAVDGKAVPPLGPVGMLRRDVVLDPGALLAGTAVKG